MRLPVLARAGKIISASAIPCQTVVPLSALGGEMLLQACVHGQSSPSARNTARNASATIPYPQTHTATTTASGNRQFLIRTPLFQQAPTLGGECYLMEEVSRWDVVGPFQSAPTLGGECYFIRIFRASSGSVGFSGHPPLGVNATTETCRSRQGLPARFQWAPTLGGECYIRASHSCPEGTACFNGHPPLGVNATGGLVPVCVLRCK